MVEWKIKYLNKVVYKHYRINTDKEPMEKNRKGERKKIGRKKK
jgi:hypothetical protein